MLIQAAINGARGRKEHARLPHSPAELAAAVAESVAAGASSIHLHVRNRSGKESLAPADVALILEAVRASSGASIGLSTGLWIEGDARRRYQRIARWEALPDFVSVNFDEPGAVPLAELLLERGVGVEAGLADASSAATLITSGLADRCLRLLLEPQEQDLAAARRNAAAMEALLERAGIRRPRLLHGVDSSAWPLVELAVARGHEIRVGLEDMLHLPDGEPAESNAQLVRAAKSIVDRYPLAS